MWKGVAINCINEGQCLELDLNILMRFLSRKECKQLVQNGLGNTRWGQVIPLHAAASEQQSFIRNIITNNRYGDLKTNSVSKDSLQNLASQQHNPEEEPESSSSLEIKAESFEHVSSGDLPEGSTFLTSTIPGEADVKPATVSLELRKRLILQFALRNLGVCGFANPNIHASSTKSAIVRRGKDQELKSPVTLISKQPPIQRSTIAAINYKTYHRRDDSYGSSRMRTCADFRKIMKSPRANKPSRGRRCWRPKSSPPRIPGSHQMNIHKGRVLTEIKISRK